jgi:hypothetical protein
MFTPRDMAPQLSAERFRQSSAASKREVCGQPAASEGGKSTMSIFRLSPVIRPLTLFVGRAMLQGMTAVPEPPHFQLHNQQAFETCVATTLQVLAAVGFAPALHHTQPTRETLLAFSVELNRHGGDIAALAGERFLDLPALGQGWYERLVAERDEPLPAAYHALHSVAYLGLEGGMTTATLLSAVSDLSRPLT